MVRNLDSIVYIAIANRRIIVLQLTYTANFGQISSKFFCWLVLIFESSKIATVLILTRYNGLLSSFCVILRIGFLIDNVCERGNSSVLVLLLLIGVYGSILRFTSG